MKKRFTSQRKAIKQKEYGKAVSSFCSDSLALILSCYILYAYGKQSEKSRFVDTRKTSDPYDKSNTSNESDSTNSPDSPKSPQLKDFPSAPQVGAEPAEQKKRSWFRRLTNSITARLKLSDDGYSIDLNKLLAEAIKEVYGGEVELSRNLFQIQNDALQKAVDKTMSEPEFGRLNSEFVEEFRYNTAVFSAFKAHAETEAMVALLTKEDGSLRSFWEFKKLAKKLSPKWNEQWLRTEYNTAVRSARSAVNYRNALRTKDLYPNLEYIASTAKDKRPDHLEYVGTVLPIEHPWWDTHLPPSEWNCKCSVRPSDKPTTEVPEDSGTSPTFQNNPGKTAEFVKLREHPYLKGKGTPTCPECRRQGLTGNTKLKDEESQLCPMHQLAKLAQDLVRLKKEREKLYKKLKQDSDYINVRFNSQTGGLMATHREHNFDGTGGEGEMIAQNIGYESGNMVILEKEEHMLHKVRTADGLWNGMVMEIATTTTGKSNSIVRALSHCASKPNVEVAVVVLLKGSVTGEIERSVARYNGFGRSNPAQWKRFKEIVFVFEDGGYIKSVPIE